MSIKVKVYAPGFIKHDSFDQNGFVELVENDSIHSLYRKLKVPLPILPILTTYVNYVPAKLSTKLQEGDVVSLLFPISGG
jgi:molybdopterin converting factor small subunit